ncbi:MAG: hypothetical protein IJX51_05615 [Clostridia bacterium]|nr:hypothetical protein [Clostridia bacterium]MBQ8393233.1 hypothetical protein [Clostridia bacterium]
MKKKITAIILAVIMILSTFGTMGISAATATKVNVSTVINDVRYQDELIAWENMTVVPSSATSKFELRIDEESLTVAIRNKKTGEIMLSNPLGTINGKQLSAKVNNETYTSQLKIDYRGISSETGASYYTFRDCVKYDNPQHTLTIGTDTITVVYTFGELNQVPCLPEALRYDDMQLILQDLRDHGYSEYQIDTFKSYYDYYSITLTEADENGERHEVTIRDKDRESLITKYEQYGIKEEGFYYLRGTIGLTKRKANEDMLKSIKVDGEQKYTEEKKFELYKHINYVEATSTIPVITVPLTYTVTDTGFKADVDASKVTIRPTMANDGTEKIQYVIDGIGVLPFFNAANVKTTSNADQTLMTKETETGYTFIPDGSGALVRFEDVVRQGATNDMTFSLYGSDNVYYNLKPKNEEQMTMPVFGMVINERIPTKADPEVYEDTQTGFFAIIENGDAVASITSSHNANYHSVYASFKLSSADRLKMSSTATGVEGTLSLNSGVRFNETCSVNYVMLDPNANRNSQNEYETSYIGMAKYYRNYLVENGDITKIANVNDQTTLFVEVLGSMKVEKKIATFPVTVNEALTTFEQVKKMQRELTTGTAVITNSATGKDVTIKAADKGVGPINFILTGFANEGLSSKYPTKVKWLGSVGGKDGFLELLDDAKANGYEVSPNFDFAYSTYLYGSDNIKYRTYGAKSLDDRFAMKLTYEPAYQMLSYVGGIVISAGSYDYAYEKFAKAVEDYDDKMTNLAVGTLGSDLNSDYNLDDDNDDDIPDNFIYRTEAAKKTEQLLSKLSIKGANTNTNYKLLVRKGNSYAYKYVNYIVDSALDSSRRTNQSEAVPFMGMVLHGYIVYTGEALNMDGDADYAFLKSLENGANLYFTLAYDNVEYLKLNWRFAQYYSVDYSLWFEYVVTKYNEYDALMASKQTSYISEHEFLNTSEGGTKYKVYNKETGEALENSRVVRVEYSNREGFFLNYNADYEVVVQYDINNDGKLDRNDPVYEIPALGYAEYKSTGVKN